MLDNKLVLLAIHAKNLISFGERGSSVSLGQEGANDDLTESDIAAWMRLRTQAQELVQQYLDNPCNVDLLAHSQDLVDSFQSIDNPTESAEYRARVNIANMTGRMRRTHFTAYVTGKYSVDDRLPPIFKIWLHNAAANSAMDLMDCVSVMEDCMRADLGADQQHANSLQRAPDVLRLFMNGAGEDAYRFLDIAYKYSGGESQCLTRFNQARLAAYRDNSELAVGRIEEIVLPQENDHPAVLQWHLDNLHSFQGDQKFEEKMKSAGSDAYDTVSTKLAICKDQAERYVNSRGGPDRMWSEEKLSSEDKQRFRFSKAVIAGCGAGSAVLAPIAYFWAPEIHESLQYFIQAVADHAEAIADVGTSELANANVEYQVALGDGGWAITKDAGVLAATFGDGGWA